MSSAETFKYAVQVEDAEGNQLPETVVAKDFADVTVVDADTVTKVHELGLVTTVEGKDVAWKNPTVTQADQVKIVATVFENGLGTKTTDKDEEGKATTEATELATKTPTIAKVTSSDPTVAFYDNTKGIQVRKDGKVTFTVEFEDKDIEALQTTVEVTTVAKQTATSIKAEDLKVKADAETAVKFDVLDQNGEKLRTNAIVFVAVKPEGKKEAEATALEVTAGAATTDLTFAKGNNVVTVYGADKENAVDKEVVLGTFKVEAVDVSDEAKIEEYKLVQADDNKKDDEDNFLPLDLNIDEDVNNTELKLDVEAYIKDIKVGLKDGVELVAKSSDAKVVALESSTNGYATVTQEDAKVTATAKAAGEAVITLYTKEGDLLTPVATYDVKVNDTTKAITELPFKEGVKHVTVKDSDETEDKLKDAVIAAVDEKVKLTANKIAKVEPVKANGIVIVTMAKEYGGKEIVLPALFTSLESLETVVDSTTTPAVPAVEQTFVLESIKSTSSTITVEDQKFQATELEELKSTVEAAELTDDFKYAVEATGDNWVVTKSKVVSNTAIPTETDVEGSTSGEKEYKIVLEENTYTATELEELKSTVEAAELTDDFKYAVEATGDNWVVTKSKVVSNAAIPTLETSYTATDGLDKSYTAATPEDLATALTTAGYTVDSETDETKLVVTKAEVPAKTTYTQTVTFTFSNNVTLADDASFELKDADGKVIATEANAEDNAKTVTIKIITEDKPSPTVATATLEGATVNKILQIIKDEKVESTEG
ncbi:hypothetical protein [Metalysinibacillus jejuensis]|uniref:hypothetical protein n=1 Tax=Metalysinibacillus jejuensis TaxID=914327 RepID=UPI000D3577DA|nr:hypothetical protein [Metalysinibacillus jejuensis]